MLYIGPLHKGGIRRTRAVISDCPDSLQAVAKWHYDQNLKLKGMMGLLHNIMEQRHLKLRAETYFRKKTLTKHFTKVL